MRNQNLLIVLFSSFLFISCNKEDNYESLPTDSYPNVVAAFGANLDLNNLQNYANQTVPGYITKDNSNGNVITDKAATLGRVLFYDKKLSTSNTIACASCHKQALAFGDDAIASQGVNATTGRHSMRLVNNRFANELKYFWDERAANLETQTTMPIKDHGEMGYSGLNGDQSFSDLIIKLSAVGYYKELFKFVYGTETITEARIQNALAQFIRSIQSFDSKYDVGRATAPNDGAPFTNFTAQENQGKNLFLAPPTFNANGSRTGGGLGCAGCHRAPEFDIDPLTKNNGIIGVIGSTGTIDVTNTKSPSLRDLINPSGTLNGRLMHTANFTSLQQAIGHYGTINIAPGNTNLDPRLTPGGIGQQLNLTNTEVQAVVAFLQTLTGTNVYTNTKWSNPFPN